MPYISIAEQLLAEYRELERGVGELPPHSAAAIELRLEMDRLREAYNRVVQTAQAEQARIPPPFPAEPA